MKWFSFIFFCFCWNASLEASGVTVQEIIDEHSLGITSSRYSQITPAYPKNPDLGSHLDCFKSVFKGRTYTDWVEWLTHHSAAHPVIMRRMQALPAFEVSGSHYQLRLLSAPMLEDMLLLPVDREGSTLLDYMPGAVLNNPEHHGGISILLNLQKEWKDDENLNVFGLYEDGTYVGHSLVMTHPSGSHVELLKADPTKRPLWHGSILLLLQMIVLQGFYLEMSPYHNFSPILTAFSKVDDLMLNDVYLNGGFCVYDFVTNLWDNSMSNPHFISFQSDYGLCGDGARESVIVATNDSESYEALAKSSGPLTTAGQIYDYFSSTISPALEGKAVELRRKIVETKASFFVDLDKWRYFVKFDALKEKANL
ncbi:MAG: hypothetical protein ACTHJ4_02625 [Candidatus Nucleicultricaceae bacterium]